MKVVWHANVYRYRDGKAVWFHNGTLPKNAERTIFAALYFRLIGQGC